MVDAVSSKPWHIREVDIEARDAAIEEDNPRKIAAYKIGKMFFLNDMLHRKIKVNRPAGIVYAYNYDTDEMCTYTYSDFKKYAGRAYRIYEVCKIFNRHHTMIRDLIYHKKCNINPKRVFRKNGVGVYYLSEKDLYTMREYYATLHRGRPRLDGLVTPGSDVPTLEEFEYRIGKRQMTYVKTKDGRYVPTWKAENFSV